MCYQSWSIDLRYSTILISNASEAKFQPIKSNVICHLHRKVLHIFGPLGIMFLYGICNRFVDWICVLSISFCSSGNEIALLWILLVWLWMIPISLWYFPLNQTFGTMIALKQVPVQVSFTFWFIKGVCVHHTLINWPNHILILSF